MDEETKLLVSKIVSWWEDEAQHMTYGEYGEHNVFDTIPEFVEQAMDLKDKMNE